jgi:hypothetical protein
VTCSHLIRALPLGSQRAYETRIKAPSGPVEATTEALTRDVGDKGMESVRSLEGEVMPLQENARFPRTRAWAGRPRRPSRSDSGTHRFWMWGEGQCGP